ncbi:unnamed protein product [Amoebophrya sp. A25]|nr:unnamed protein product [Amoebophrya sp. A25]|eukprot:GSA25T00022552001.1
MTKQGMVWRAVAGDGGQPTKADESTGVYNASSTPGGKKKGKGKRGSASKNKSAAGIGQVVSNPATSAAARNSGASRKTSDEYKPPTNNSIVSIEDLVGSASTSRNRQRRQRRYNENTDLANEKSIVEEEDDIDSVAGSADKTYPNPPSKKGPQCEGGPASSSKTGETRKKNIQITDIPWATLPGASGGGQKVAGKRNLASGEVGAGRGGPDRALAAHLIDDSTRSHTEKDGATNGGDNLQAPKKKKFNIEDQAVLSPIARSPISSPHEDDGHQIGKEGEICGRFSSAGAAEQLDGAARQSSKFAPAERTQKARSSNSKQSLVTAGRSDASSKAVQSPRSESEEPAQREKRDESDSAPTTTFAGESKGSKKGEPQQDQKTAAKEKATRRDRPPRTRMSAAARAANAKLRELNDQRNMQKHLDWFKQKFWKTWRSRKYWMDSVKDEIKTQQEWKSMKADKEARSTPGRRKDSSMSMNEDTSRGAGDVNLLDTDPETLEKLPSEAKQLAEFQKIEDFLQRLANRQQLQPRRKQAMEIAFKRIKAAVSDLFGDNVARLELFGSVVNGCATNASDYDCGLRFAENEKTMQELKKRGDISFDSVDGIRVRAGNELAVCVLKKLQDRVKEDPECLKTQLIANAKVPILQVEYRPKEEKFRPSCFDVSITTKAWTFDNSRLLYLYLHMHPKKIVRHLAVLLKEYVKCANLGSAKEGMLSSYSYLLLLIHYLQVVNVLPRLQHPKYWYMGLGSCGPQYNVQKSEHASNAAVSRSSSAHEKMETEQNSVPPPGTYTNNAERSTKSSAVMSENVESQDFFPGPAPGCREGDTYWFFDPETAWDQYCSSGTGGQDEADSPKLSKREQRAVRARLPQADYRALFNLEPVGAEAGGPDLLQLFYGFFQYYSQEMDWSVAPSMVPRHMISVSNLSSKTRLAEYRRDLEEELREAKLAEKALLAKQREEEEEETAGAAAGGADEQKQEGLQSDPTEGESAENASVSDTEESTTAKPSSKTVEETEVEAPRLLAISKPSGAFGKSAAFVNLGLVSQKDEASAPRSQKADDEEKMPSADEGQHESPLIGKESSDRSADTVTKNEDAAQEKPRKESKTVSLKHPQLGSYFVPKSLFRTSDSLQSGSTVSPATEHRSVGDGGVEAMTEAANVPPTDGSTTTSAPAAFTTKSVENDPVELETLRHRFVDDLIDEFCPVRSRKNDWHFMIEDPIQPDRFLGMNDYNFRNWFLVCTNSTCKNLKKKSLQLADVEKVFKYHWKYQTLISQHP